MNLSQKHLGHIIVFTAIVIFSINIPVCKYLTNGHISALGLTGMRILFGCILFWVTALIVGIEKVKRKDHLILFLSGLSGILLNQALFIVGLSLTAPIAASIIITSTPLFAMIIAAIILKEIITLQKVIGVFLGAIGAIVLVYFSSHTDGESNTLGNMLIIGSSFCYAFYLVISKPLSEKYKPVTLMQWMFTYAAIFFLPFVYKDMIHAPLFHEKDPQALLALLYPLFGASYIAYLLIPMAQKRIRTTTISMYNNLQPIIASIIAIAMGQDHMDWTKVVAVLFVLGGVYLVTKSKSRNDLIHKIPS